jgi:hypothetical protein
MRVLQRILITLALCFLANTVFADGIVLELPVECDMGGDCVIQNYTDREPGPEIRDYMCGLLSYDGHGGTDFRVRDLVAMRRGVNVLAAAPGVVRAIRDGMDDVNVAEIGREAIQGAEAGNAVAIVHGDGWETQYSHLKKGSVRVKPGQNVKAGQVLGQIGMSGMAEFPHVEFMVRLNGESVDPFVGVTDRSGCGFTVDPLWSDAAARSLDYIPTGLLSAGLTSAIPKPGEAREGRHRASAMTITAPMIIFWVDVFGVQAGDRERSILTAPDGSILADTKFKEIPTFQAQHFIYAGKRRPPGLWPEGKYTGHYVLQRLENGKWKTVIDSVRDVAVR